jgi:hypothetical protein
MVPVSPATATPISVRTVDLCSIQLVIVGIPRVALQIDDALIAIIAADMCLPLVDRSRMVAHDSVRIAKSASPILVRILLGILPLILQIILPIGRKRIRTKIRCVGLAIEFSVRGPIGN